jgi:hypothetical protein
VPLAAQTQEELPEDTESVQEVNPSFPVLPIIRTALDGKFSWHPEFPLEIPSDSFSLTSGKAASIQLEIGEETYTCEWNEDGQLVQFPLFNLSENRFMASVQYTQAGEIDTINLVGSSNTEEETASETIIEIGIEIMETIDDEVSLVRIHRNGEYYFAVFHYWDVYASETWFNAEGNAEGLLVLEYVRTHEKFLVLTRESFSGEAKNIVTYDYDSWGNISQVNAEDRKISVLYNDNAQPKYLERLMQTEYDPSHLEDNQIAPQNEKLTFQWDERNFLVSVKGIPDENIFEKRYEYTLDAEGNWIERREINMIALDEYLFPSEGETIRRTIQYSVTP